MFWLNYCYFVVVVAAAGTAAAGAAVAAAVGPTGNATVSSASPVTISTTAPADNQSFTCFTQTNTINSATTIVQNKNNGISFVSYIGAILILCLLMYNLYIGYWNTTNNLFDSIIVWIMFAGMHNIWFFLFFANKQTKF